MLINEVCKKCKLTKKAVEYYGEQGLIKLVVMENGYRQFSDDDAMKLKKIAILRGLGLSVADIRITLEKDDISMLHDVLEKKSMKSKIYKRSKNSLDSFHSSGIGILLVSGWRHCSRSSLCLIVCSIRFPAVMAN